MNKDKIKSHLLNSKTIAVVGFSNDKLKAAHTVPKYLTKFYDVIPINPNHKEIAGRESFPSVKDLDEYLNKTGKSLDIINVFRPSDQCLSVVQDIVEMKNKPKLIWLQLHIKNEEAKELALQNNIEYIEDQCIYVVHKDVI